MPSFDSQVPATLKYCSALGNSIEDFRGTHAESKKMKPEWYVFVIEEGGQWELIHELPPIV